MDDKLQDTPTREAWCGPRHPRSHGLFPGIFLIILGGLFLMRELNLLPEGMSVGDFWPLLVIGFGLAHLRCAPNAASALTSLLIAGVGTLLLLGTLHVIHFPMATLWPLLLVVIGVAVLFGGGLCRRRWRHGRYSAGGRSETVSQDVIDRQIVMGGSSLRVDSQNFQGGSLSAVMAGMEIDLRRAAMPEAGATIDVRAVMAGIELRVPDSWQVVCEISPVLGGVEDRTQPANGGAPRPRLQITGSVVLGAIEIRN